MFGLGFASGVNVGPELQFLSPGRQPTSGEAVIAQAMTYALSSREYNDVVFLDDCTCEMGIDPRVFAKETVLGAVAYCIAAQVNRELRFFQTGERGR
jgi:hypothetical protein